MKVSVRYVYILLRRRRTFVSYSPFFFPFFLSFFLSLHRSPPFPSSSSPPPSSSSTSFSTFVVVIVVLITITTDQSIQLLLIPEKADFVVKNRLTTTLTIKSRDIGANEEDLSHQGLRMSFELILYIYVYIYI